MEAAAADCCGVNGNAHNNKNHTHTNFRQEQKETVDTFFGRLKNCREFHASRLAHMVVFDNSAGCQTPF
jgi:hypothetical protein